MLLAAFAFWNGSGGLRLAEIIETLDVELAQAVCSLVISVKHGADHVDSWLVIYGTDRRQRGSSFGVRREPRDVGAMTARDSWLALLLAAGGVVACGGRTGLDALLGGGSIGDAGPGAGLA